jgi:serine/threonine-protein kinase RsbW
LHGGSVEATVEDDGKPFDPLAAPAPDLTSSPRQPGGVGLHFVRNLTDELTYTRRDRINHLRLMKRLGQ